MIQIEELVRRYQAAYEGLYTRVRQEYGLNDEQARARMDLIVRGGQ